MSKVEFKPTLKHQALIDAANGILIEGELVVAYLKPTEDMLIGCKILIDKDVEDSGGAEYQSEPVLAVQGFMKILAERVFNMKAALLGYDPEGNFRIRDSASPTDRSAA